MLISKRPGEVVEIVKSARWRAPGLARKGKRVLRMELLRRQSGRFVSWVVAEDSLYHASEIVRFPFATRKAALSEWAGREAEWDHRYERID